MFFSIVLNIHLYFADQDNHKYMMDYIYYVINYSQVIFNRFVFSFFQIQFDYQNSKLSFLRKMSSGVEKPWVLS